MLDQPAFVQEQDLVGVTAGLPEIVGRHHDFHAALVHRRHHGLDHPGRGRIEIGGRLVEEQHLGLERPGAGERKALLLAARKHARRAVDEVGEADLAQRRLHAIAALGAWHAVDGERVGDVAASRAPQQHRALEDERLGAAQPDRIVPGPADAAGGRLQQTMAEPQQQAFAGTVRAEHHRARAGFEG